MKQHPMASRPLEGSRGLLRSAWQASACFILGAGCLIACTSVDIDPPDSFQGTGGALSSSLPEQACSEGALRCESAKDCPAPHQACEGTTCVAGCCANSPLPPGTRVTTDQAAGDCWGLICDGVGTALLVPDDTDTPQSLDDCHEGICTSGVPHQIPRAKSTPCTENGGKVCGDPASPDAGQCLECLADQDCSDPALPRCGPGGECLACLSAADCPSPASTCLSTACEAHACVVAFTPAGTTCTDGGSRCNGQGTCLECLSSSDCGPGQVCGTPAGPHPGHCVGCETDHDCTDPTQPFCDADSTCVACFSANQCPPSTLACVVTTCNANTCGFLNAPLGTPCTEGGNKCDGQGNCVECLSANDCPAPTTACVLRSCESNTCVTHDVSKGETCTENGGQVCDGKGTCVACNTNTDCPQGTTCDAAHTCTGPSCLGLATTCGPNGDESCCASAPVTGGTFKRSFDGLAWKDPNFPATVSDFTLDRFEITVGRFRRFVNAVLSGWKPTEGSGKHTHLSAGGGLRGSGDVGYESGWNSTWNTELANSPALWDARLGCSPGVHTWTSAVGPNEDKSIDCLNWYEAYAFCIWDGGFLPSEAEWGYAAAHGNEQRVYPWSIPANSTVIDSSHAVFGGASISTVGSKSPQGDGFWGHTDLSGNVWEWVLDAAGNYANPCHDCTAIPVQPTQQRMARGADASSYPPGWLLNASRAGDPPAVHNGAIGARCARSL